MTGYEAYVMYCGLKNHFSKEEYDFIKYNGKIRSNVDSYEKRKDRFYFEKLAKRKDAKEFIISNFISNPHAWIGDLVNSSFAEKEFMDWKKRNQALSYWFEEDLKKLLNNFDENVIIVGNTLPKLLKLLLQKKISIETVVILNDLVQFFPNWNKRLKDDPIWKDINLICRKYRSFMEYDRKKMKQIVLKIFIEEEVAA